MGRLRLDAQDGRVIFAHQLAFHPGQRYSRRYLSARELGRLRQSPGSPLLVGVLAALSDPLACWIPEDLGVDEEGCYELLDLSDEQERGQAPMLTVSKGSCPQ